MGQSRLDVYSVQNIAEEILYAIEGIQEASELILYTGLTSSFVLNGTLVPKSFGTVLVARGQIGSEKNGRLIKFMNGATFTEETFISNELTYPKGTVLTEDIIKRILQEKKIDFQEIKSFPQNDSIESSNCLPEMWIGRDVNVLRESLGSISNQTAIYYPSVEGNIELTCYDQIGTPMIIDQRAIKGLIELDDKLLLVVEPTAQDMKDFRVDTSHRIRSGGSEGYPGLLGYYLLTPNISNILSKLKALGINVTVKEDLPEFLNQLKTSSNVPSKT